MDVKTYPQSVGSHLIKANPGFWEVNRSINWHTVGASSITLVSGSSFIDPKDSYGPMGNPFAVVIGESVEMLTQAERLHIARVTNTPETVFINHCTSIAPGKFKVSLTVYTPSGTEMGACAHGFLGALQTLLQTGVVDKESEIAIETTLNTTARAVVDGAGQIALEFQAEVPVPLRVDTHVLSSIYGVDFQILQNRGVLSVGSPKLTLEISAQLFETLQRQLKHINYEALLAFQQTAGVNGIHLFCRNQNGLPEKCIQNNAFSGKDNLADRATGVSNAAQISTDSRVAEGQQVAITQYSFNGPSAVLIVTKKPAHKVLVGGAATLFNTELASR